MKQFYKKGEYELKSNGFCADLETIDFSKGHIYIQTFGEFGGTYTESYVIRVESNILTKKIVNKTMYNNTTCESIEKAEVVAIYNNGTIRVKPV